MTIRRTSDHHEHHEKHEKVEPKLVHKDKEQAPKKEVLKEEVPKK